MKIRRWPSVRMVFIWWALITTLACVTYVAYDRSLPPDELLMANTWSFQLLVSILFVAFPSFAALLLFMLVGAIAKRHVLTRRSSESPPAPAEL